MAKQGVDLVDLTEEDAGEAPVELALTGALTALSLAAHALNECRACISTMIDTL